MGGIRCIAVLMGVLAAMPASAEKGNMVEVVAGSHWRWAGNFASGAVLYAECASLVGRLGHDPVEYCGNKPLKLAEDGCYRIAAGFIPDLMQPAGVHHFYYLDARACPRKAVPRCSRDSDKCIAKR